MIIWTEMEITPSSLSDFILHHISDFGKYIIYFITIIACYVIINSFGYYYLDSHIVIGSFQMYLLKNK